MKSFEAFKRNSFHATEDSWEIRDEFYRFLSSRLDVRIYIEYCSAIDLSISVNQAHLGLYYDLLGNIMRKPARYSVIFEQNAALEPFLENLAARAVPSKYRSRGLVRYSISSKQENSCLAVADYAMWAFAEWKRENFTTDPQKKQFRTWKSIQRLVSVARERQGKTIRRQLPVAPMIHSR
ncbi:hypothetical protein M3697_05480 [Janibacter melonis]|uniref:hypothetical protein n=1 Tax=Janibacter melonis TaxID=262209 RepID=UPI0020431A89|nr:hypothetical protein [Janibacter melonis]MCM3554557.1 hypothetical protein [Janibacter melonis]